MYAYQRGTHQHNALSIGPMPCRSDEKQVDGCSRFAAETDDCILQFWESGCKFALSKGFWHLSNGFRV